MFNSHTKPSFPGARATIKHLAVAILAASALLAGPGYLGTAWAETGNPPPAVKEETSRPSDWNFDRDGRLLAVPGRMQAVYDPDGQLREVTVYDSGANGTFTSGYTLLTDRSQSKQVLRLTKTRTGKQPFTHDYFYENVQPFTLAPYFLQVQGDGKKVEISSEAAMKADPATILAGISITMGAGHSESRPLFLGAEYARRIGFF